jgi:hypothetical protein
MPAQIATLNFNDPVNASLQVGDIVYYSTTGTVPGSGFTTVITANTVRFGIVNSISSSGLSINVVYHPDFDGIPASGDEIKIIDMPEAVLTSCINP